jgi:hypothetical protein
LVVQAITTKVLDSDVNKAALLDWCRDSNLGVDDVTFRATLKSMLLSGNLLLLDNGRIVVQLPSAPGSIEPLPPQTCDKGRNTLVDDAVRPNLVGPIGALDAQANVNVFAALRVPLNAHERLELVCPRKTNSEHFKVWTRGGAYICGDILEEIMRLVVAPMAAEGMRVALKSPLWLTRLDFPDQGEGATNWRLTLKMKELVPLLGDPTATVHAVLLLYHRPNEEHWTLGVLDVRRAHFRYYDSASPNHTKAKRAFLPLKRWLDKAAANDGRQIAWCKEPYHVPRRGAIPKQYSGNCENDVLLGVDCGVFALLFAVAHCHCIDLRTRPFSQKDIKSMRERLALEFVRAVHTENAKRCEAVDANADVDEIEEFYFAAPKTDEYSNKKARKR